MTQKIEDPPWAAAGLQGASTLSELDEPGIAPTAGRWQGKILEFPARRIRPRRIDVRIAAAAGLTPVGRSRAFRLSHDDLDELIAAAMRMERRA